MWAWSSGRIHGTRPRTYMSNEAGAIAMAFSSASLASAVRPIWPRAAASQRYERSVDEARRSGARRQGDRGGDLRGSAQSGIRRAAPAAGRAPRPRWCCVCWCSSTCATGVTAFRGDRRYRYRDRPRPASAIAGGRQAHAERVRLPRSWDRARGASAVALVHVENVEARTDMSSGLACRPLVNTSVFSVEGHFVRATFNG
jgi:hypothetical protein